jgi:hypothetical protein
MMPQDHYLDALRDAILKPTRAFVGVVDDVLNLCHANNLQIDWCMETCRVQRLGVESADTLNVPLRKSVFRAILARVATLCDEQAPGSFAPFGGQGELKMGAGTILRLSWMNTLGEQKLTVIPIQSEANRETPTAVAAAHDLPIRSVERRS